MVRLSRKPHRYPSLAAAAALLALVPACSAGGGKTAVTGPSEPQPTFPISAKVNQLRDNYSKQIVSIELTNTSDAVQTVLGARLESALFTAAISWQASPAGIELPPGQAKSLPAQLPAPVCQPAGPGQAAPDVALRVAPDEAGSAGPTASPASAPEIVLPASDPYQVLARNNAEMCLAQAAEAVAVFRLDPGLEVAADGRTAVVRLLIAPRDAGAGAGAGTLTIARIDGTTLLAEDSAVPWPRDVPVHAGAASSELRLGIRPARCDPHAVAEDKVGTLLPLRVSVGGRDGVLKVDAGQLLRGRIYDFVTAACTHQ
jgi:hypothetical protein